MHKLNLGILAHVDAGKTSLTERLLHAAGVIDRVGRVDDGSTQTDSLALERRRGITIKSAVVAFHIAGVTPHSVISVNLIDTPGHPDFIAEVERVLGVLDGAVLVVSAVEGVQPQTRVIMRTLRRLRIPTLVFVNKIDRAGARAAELLPRLADRLAPGMIAMGSVRGLGTRAAAYVPYGPGDPAHRSALAETLAEHDEELLAAYVEDEAAIPYGRLRAGLATQTAGALVHPVYFGSAITGAGVPELTTGIAELLPAAGGDPDAAPSGTVFKIERGPAGEKIAYVRMFAGTIRARDQVPYGDEGAGSADGARDGVTENGVTEGGGVTEGKVTTAGVVDRGAAIRTAPVTAGDIGKLRGLGGVRVGDTIGRRHRPAARHHFAPPTLETVVVPDRPSRRGALHAALTELAEQDPLIGLRQDDTRQELYVSLYGEVQKEVVQATLAEEYGLAVTFRETTTICVERVVAAGAAVEIIDTPPNPFLGTVGLRVDPAPPGENRYALKVELGSMPYAFMKAVEETVRETLRQGLYGWTVDGWAVTLTHTGYWPRQSHAHAHFDKTMSSTAGDFRLLTPLVLMDALRRAGTLVHEPMHRFHLELPPDTFGTALPALTRLGALPGPPQVTGALGVIEGLIPAAAVHGLEQRLPGLTRGEGMLESLFDGYRPVAGPPPTRPRTDNNPLNREAYLLATTRRVTS